MTQNRNERGKVNYGRLHFILETSTWGMYPSFSRLPMLLAMGDIHKPRRLLRRAQKYTKNWPLGWWMTPTVWIFDKSIIRFFACYKEICIFIPRDRVSSVSTFFLELSHLFLSIFFHCLTINFFITLVANNRSIVSAILQDFFALCGLFTTRTIRVRR